MIHDGPDDPPLEQNALQNAMPDKDGFLHLA